MIFSRQALLVAMAALSGSVSGFTPLSYNSASVRFSFDGFLLTSPCEALRRL